MISVVVKVFSALRDHILDAFDGDSNAMFRKSHRFQIGML